MQNHTATSVLCAMSGGVDSSAAAVKLLKEGYHVEGVTMLLLDTTETANEIRDAQKVCRQLGIEHVVLDCRHEFRHHVIDCFCRDYLNGKTPNPCIECNKYLKFGVLHEYRKQRGFDYLATGHYARIFYDENAKRYGIQQALHSSKDQSYVLYHLNQDELAHTLFPLDSLEKADTRKLAQEAGLQTAHKAESQDICFIPNRGDYTRFVCEYTHATPEPGPIALKDGTVLGQHKGLLNYTIGQRKGIGIGYPEPLFVLRKDYDTNTLVVGVASEKAVHTIVAQHVNFVSRAPWQGPLLDRASQPLPISAKSHYRQKPQTGTVSIENDRLILHFKEPSSPAAPGQSLVIYENDTVLCGGTIVAAYA